MPARTELPRGGVNSLPSRTKEEILAGAFADVSVDVQRDAFDVAVENGLHLDELRVHVVRTGLSHRGQGVRGKAGPGRDANIHPDVLRPAKIFTPGIIGDIALGGKADGIHSEFAIAADDERTDVAGPHPVGADGFHHGIDKLLTGVVHRDTINFRGVEQALHVFVSAENRRASGQPITADAFKDGRTIIDDMRHDVNLGIIPVDEFSVVPDFFSGLTGMLWLLENSKDLLLHYKDYYKSIGSRIWRKSIRRRRLQSRNSPAGERGLLRERKPTNL